MWLSHVCAGASEEEEEEEDKESSGVEEEEEEEEEELPVREVAALERGICDADLRAVKFRQRNCLASLALCCRGLAPS